MRKNNNNIIKLANDLENMIDYWKTVKLDPRKTKEIYDVNIKQLSSKEVKNIRRDIFRFNVLKKYPYLSVGFLTMLWYKHLDFKENPLKFLNEYFNKYSKAMYVVNMLTSGMYLTKKIVKTDIAFVLNKPIEKLTQKEYVDYVITNMYYDNLKFVKNVYKIGKEIILKDTIENPKFVNSVIFSNNKKKYVFSALTENTQNLIKENVNQDVRKKIETDGLTDRQITNILNIIDLINFDIIPNTKEHNIEFVLFIKKLKPEQKVIETIENEYIKLHLVENGILIEFTNKKELLNKIKNFDYSKLEIDKIIKVLENIY